jgi:hypothetical protein
MFGAHFTNHKARMRCPKTCVIYEPKDDCPAIGFVNPMLMLSPVRKYVPAVRISQKPSRRSPKANQVLTVDRAGEVSI